MKLYDSFFNWEQFLEKTRMVGYYEDNSPGQCCFVLGNHCTEKRLYLMRKAAIIAAEQQSKVMIVARDNAHKRALELLAANHNLSVDSVRICTLKDFNKDIITQCYRRRGLAIDEDTVNKISGPKAEPIWDWKELSLFASYAKDYFTKAKEEDYERLKDTFFNKISSMVARELWRATDYGQWFVHYMRCDWGNDSVQRLENAWSAKPSLSTYYHELPFHLCSMKEIFGGGTNSKPCTIFFDDSTCLAKDEVFLYSKFFTCECSLYYFIGFKTYEEIQTYFTWLDSRFMDYELFYLEAEKDEPKKEIGFLPRRELQVAHETIGANEIVGLLYDNIAAKNVWLREYWPQNIQVHEVTPDDVSLEPGVLNVVHESIARNLLFDRYYSLYNRIDLYDDYIDKYRTVYMPELDNRRPWFHETADADNEKAIHYWDDDFCKAVEKEILVLEKQGVLLRKSNLH